MSCLHHTLACNTQPCFGAVLRNHLRGAVLPTAFGIKSAREQIGGGEWRAPLVGLGHHRMDSAWLDLRQRQRFRKFIKPVIFASRWRICDRPKPVDISICELLTRSKQQLTHSKGENNEQTNATTPRPQPDSRQRQRSESRLAQSHDSVQS